MWSRGWLLLAVGITVMAAASIWAPAQPELISGGACNVAPCGTLEDPERWRRAWWLWLAGAAVAVPAAAVVVRGWARPRWPVVLLLLVVVPVALGAVAILAVVVSLLTSVHGAATTVVVGALLPAVAAVSGWIQGRAGRASA